MAAEGIDFRAIAEAATDVILRCTRDGMAIYISPSIQTLIGISPAELVGRSHVEFVHPEDKAGLMEMSEFHANAQTDGRATFRMIHKNGSVVWVEGYGRPLVDRSTGNVEFVVVLRDISDRKALEMRLSTLLLTNRTPAGVADGDDAAAPGSNNPQKRLRNARGFN